MFFRRFLLLAKKFSFCRENWTQFNSSSMVQDFPDLFYFPTILSLSFFQNSWDSSYVPVQYWISSFVSLAVKEKFAIPLKSIEILWSCFSHNFDSPCIFSITLIVKNSQIFWNLSTLSFCKKHPRPNLTDLEFEIWISVKRLEKQVYRKTNFGVCL